MNHLGNRNVPTCAHFYKMVHWGIWDLCIVVWATGLLLHLYLWVEIKKRMFYFIHWYLAMDSKTKGLLWIYSIEVNQLTAQVWSACIEAHGPGSNSYHTHTHNRHTHMNHHFYCLTLTRWKEDLYSCVALLYTLGNCMSKMSVLLLIVYWVNWVSDLNSQMMQPSNDPWPAGGSMA